MRQEDL